MVRAAPLPGRLRRQGFEMSERIEVAVTAVRALARGIGLWEFRRPDGALLPAFTAGAHIDLRLPNGLTRSYSLCNAPHETHRYVVGVARDGASRGGSAFIHDHLKPGDRIEVSAPRNNFALVEDADHVLLVAGGIGITPLWCMIQRLERLGRSWELHYAARSRADCAFLAALTALEATKPGRIHFNFDDENGGRYLDLRSLVASRRAGTHLYCCGPTPMIAALVATAVEAGVAASEVHVEYFTPPEQAAGAGGFTVVLKRSGRSFEVPQGKSILEILLDADIEVTFTCMEGTCGTCEVPVLEGIPDHRDVVLSAEQKAANRTMMVCCSGSRTSRLVLDL